MADFALIHRKVAPVGNRIVEVVRLETEDATSVSASLDYTSALRHIEYVQWGKGATPTLVSTTAVTYTNATTFPGHAVLTVSGISVADAGNGKVFDFVLWGKR